MLKPLIPTTENERLQTLESYDLLDTLPEALYDGITRLASQICGTPIALVSLVDADRQWFKSRVGLDACETPRDVSFCGHAILQTGVFHIPDSSLDPRFADNPLVTGGPKVAFYAGAPLKAPNGTQIGTLCVIDHRPRELNAQQIHSLETLAEQVMALMEFRVAARKAQEASTAKSRFLANMSHEIRTPLGSIMGFIELMKDRDLPRQDLENYLSIAARNSNHLLQLIDDILDLAKVEAGKIDIETINFDPVALIGDVKELLLPRALDKGLALVFTFDPGIPPTLVSDPTRMRQILINVVGNAIKFTDVGRVDVHVACVEGNLKVLVSDTGCGITLAQEKLLFRSFAQADPSTSRKYGGTGLGLVLSKYLSHALGGSLILRKSVPGHGSEFLLTLPTPVDEVDVQARP